MSRKRISSAALALALTVASGVYDARGQTGTTTSGTTQRSSEPSAQADHAARDYINRMTMDGLAEVQLGNLARQRASDPDVRSFGQKMVTDHTQANRELADVAAQLNVQPTTQLDKKHRGLYERLSTLHGVEFDRQYMSAMVHHHEAVLHKMQAHTEHRLTSATREGGGQASPPTASEDQEPVSAPSGQQPTGTSGVSPADGALAEWTAKTMPIVQQHLERARELQQKLK